MCEAVLPVVVSRIRTMGLFFSIVLLFGGAFPAIKRGVADVPPLLFAAGRYYISGTLLLAVALATPGGWRPDARADWLAVGAGGTLMIGGTGLNFVGLQFTTSGVSAIIFGLIPVLTVVLSWVLLPAERASPLGVLGVMVGFAGVAIVVNPGSAAAADAALVGNLLVLAAATSTALGTVLVRRSNPAMGVVPLTGWAMVVGATIQLVLAVALGESVTAIDPSTGAVFALLYLAVFAGGIAFVFYFQLIDQIGPLHVNMTSYLTPVVAVAVGWVLLGEPIPTASIVGLLVILTGFLLLEEHEIAAELARFRGAAR